MKNAAYWVEHLQMQPHPEGGYFKENYRAEQTYKFTGFDGVRSVATSIYFLLEGHHFSALHRIKSDEMWHFYDGGPLLIFTIDPESGAAELLRLGLDMAAGERPQHVVKAGHWFGSLPASVNSYSLVGCTVSPGFDFADFEMPGKTYFLDKFPQHREWIERLTR